MPSLPNAGEMHLELKAGGSAIRSVAAKAANHIIHRPTLSPCTQSMPPSISEEHTGQAEFCPRSNPDPEAWTQKRQFHQEKKSEAADRPTFSDEMKLAQKAMD
jgi:hypothetical protein